MDDTRIFRIRPLTRVFDSQELAKREIYLCTPEELNDPLEGHLEVEWAGDRILWRNLFSHYVLCLMHGILNTIPQTPGEFDSPKLDARYTADSLPTDGMKELYRSSCDRFWQNDVMEQLPELLEAGENAIRTEGMRLLARRVHFPAFDAVTRAMESEGCLPNGWRAEQLPELSRLNLAQLQQIPKLQASTDLEAIAFALNSVEESSFLREQFRRSDRTSAQARLKDYALRLFPDLYVDALLRDLIHPEWHTASFTKECSNAAMWATYGQNHTGVALVLNRPSPWLKLTGVNGSRSSVHRPERELTQGAFQGALHDVTYSDHPPRLNFFEQIGNLPSECVRRTWHSDHDGRLSQKISALHADLQRWRDEHRELHLRAVTTKRNDWVYEKEQRLLIRDDLGLRSEPGDNRKVTYAEEHLSGIVFGLRTPSRDRLRIIETVERTLSHGRRDVFSFYQMKYSHATRRLHMV